MYMLEVKILIIILCILGALYYGSKYGKKYIEFLNKKQESILLKEIQENLDNSMKELEKLVELVVLELEQTTGSLIREAIKEGTMESQELERLSIEAKDKILKIIDPRVESFLRSNMEDLDEFVEMLIESTVYKMKNL